MYLFLCCRRIEEDETQGVSVSVPVFFRRIEEDETQGVSVSVPVLQKNRGKWNTGSQCICSCFAGKQRKMKHG